MKLEILAVVKQSPDDAPQWCGRIRWAIQFVERLQAATPRWKVWEKASIGVAIRVLRMVEDVLCSGAELRDMGG